MADQAEQRESTLEEDLSSVIDQLEGDGVDETVEAAPEAAGEEIETEEEVSAEAAQEERGEQPAQEPVKGQYKAPLDWSPKLKQEFKNLPESVQKAIYDREVNIANSFQQVAQERRTAHAFNNIVGQYRGLMAAEGIQDPLQAVQGLLMTTAQLAMGNKQQKARKIADLISHYGIDIGTLDSILAGEAPATTEEDRLQQLLDQRLAPVQQLMQQLDAGRQRQVQQVQHQATQSIHEFGSDPQNEFFDDVRYVMADFLDMAANNGQHMSLQEAYDRACAMNPDIASILAERRAASKYETDSQRIARKAAAASSVHGRRSGSSNVSDTEGMSLRDTIASAMDNERRI